MKNDEVSVTAVKFGKSQIPVDNATAIARLKTQVCRVADIRQDILNVKASEEAKLQVLARLDDFDKTLGNFIKQLERTSR